MYQMFHLYKIYHILYCYVNIFKKIIQNQGICNIMTNEKRNIFCKNQIADSFVTLLKERNIQNISVTDIVQTAQVSRISFYRNFKDKEDILRYYITRETDRWLSQTTDNYLTLTKESIKPYIVFLLNHMYEYREITDILMRDERMYLLEEEFDRRFFERLADISSCWQIVYNIGGVYKLFCYWAKTGYKETPQEIAELV